MAMCAVAGVCGGGAMYSISQLPSGGTALVVDVDIAGAILDVTRITSDVTNLVKTGPGDLAGSPM